MDFEYDSLGALTAAVERYGPSLLPGLASTLNPAGYQAALMAARRSQCKGQHRTAAQSLASPNPSPTRKRTLVALARVPIP